MPTIGIIGCGLVGSYVGLHLHSSGQKVFFIGRSESWRDELLGTKHITTTSSSSLSKSVAKGSELNIVLSLDKVGEKLDYVIISVKRPSLSKVCEQIEKSPGVCRDATIVTLMNGVSATTEVIDQISWLRDRPGHAQVIIEGMWSTNIIREVKEGINYHMGTSGFCYLQENEKGIELAAIFNKCGLETKVHPQMIGVQYGKLLMNLNNAINALSGKPLKQQLADPSYRSILAECMREALSCYQLNDIIPVALTPLPFSWLPALMSYVPQPIFLLMMPVIVKVDDQATSSMYEDLKLKRDTEIEYLQGEVCRLAKIVGVAVPFNSAVRERIRERESVREGIVSLEASEIITC